MNSSIRILVVDDDKDLRAAMVRLLKGAGYEVNEVDNGISGLEQAREWKPDLLLLDVDMPGMNGLEVCTRIKSDPTLDRLFVVMVSASCITSDQQSLGLETGADGYIARPIANRELIARVQAYIRLQQSESALRQSQEQLKQALEEKDRLISDLQDALSQVKTLRGLIPICAGCKKIRDDKGFWSQVETYIAKHSDAKFSHGLCPDCVAKYYPEIKLNLRRS